MDKSKLRADTQIFGKQVSLGGSDAQVPAWGDVGGALVVLNSSGNSGFSGYSGISGFSGFSGYSGVNPLVLIRSTKIGDVVLNVEASALIQGNLKAGSITSDEITIPSGSGFPGYTPVIGDLFYRTDTDAIFVFGVSGWEYAGIFQKAIIFKRCTH